MWHNINPAAQHNWTTAHRQHQHTAWDDLLIQHGLLGDPSSYLLLYSCGHKPSEGCKTSQYPLCRLAKIQPNRTFQRKEGSRGREKRGEEKRRVSQALIRGRTGWEEGRRGRGKPSFFFFFFFESSQFKPSHAFSVYHHSREDYFHFNTSIKSCQLNWQRQTAVKLAY